MVITGCFIIENIKKKTRYYFDNALNRKMHIRLLFLPWSGWKAFFFESWSYTNTACSSSAVNNAGPAAARSPHSVHFPRHRKVLKAA